MKEENIKNDPKSENEIDFYNPSYEPGSVIPRSIVDEMKSNYLDYSMSVIVSRALPEVKDGLKPSQRRILVSMNDLGLTPSANYRKSAKIAGDTSGNYHPHGESVVYPTMVKLAQDFSTRYPLVDGQGNFGSIDGDPPAAMRYTEAKMSKYSMEILRELDKGTVTFVQNYDGTRLEPQILPSLFPNLLCNGSDGIAVGMATKIPPHNLTEILDALIQMIERGNKWEGKYIYNELREVREKIEDIPKTLESRPLSYLTNYVNDTEEDIKNLEDRLAKNNGLEEYLYPMFESDITPEDLIKYVPGPDFPTGGTIYDQKEIINMYATGRGRVLTRAKATIEETQGGKFQIIVTELPFQVNKAHLLEKIAYLAKEKKLTGIADIRDESNRDGMRVVIILKKDAQPKTVLNKLYKYTEMQKAFNANMIALVDQEPTTLTIKRMLELFLSFRMTVTIRKHEYDLAQAKYRAHILEGLLKALDILDEIIATIRGSKTQEEAKNNLITKYKFTTVQAQAILDMQLRKLAALERQKISDEHEQLKKDIEIYLKVLNSQEEILRVVKEDFGYLREKYGDERRTKVIKGKVDEISEEDLVPSEDTLITISHAGYVKRISPETYRIQKRGGKGVMGAITKEGDFIKHAFLCNTHDDLMLFTNKGRVFIIKAYEIPEYSRTAKGLPIVNLVSLCQEEWITSVLTRKSGGEIMGLDEIEEEQAEKDIVQAENFKFLLMATKNGTVKKTEIKDFMKIRSNGLIAIKLDSGDELKWVKPTTGKDEIIVVTAMGRSIRFNEQDVRQTGRNSRGVRGIKFRFENDEVISMDAIRSKENKLFILSEKGFGKMTLLKNYPTQKRGGSGVFTFNVKDKTGKVVSARTMDSPNKEIVVVSKMGVVIRSNINDIPTLGRQTSGVRIMRLNENDEVAAFALI
jgi:DNA gyrase subunit A